MVSLNRVNLPPPSLCGLRTYFSGVFNARATVWSPSSPYRAEIVQCWFNKYKKILTSDILAGSLNSLKDLLIFFTKTTNIFKRWIQSNCVLCAQLKGCNTIELKNYMNTFNSFPYNDDLNFDKKIDKSAPVAN